MSSSDIVAAHLWPWPDPLIKRDRQGRVLFVNSAFLQLYGGRIEDWNGNAIGGWPAPITAGAHRFETRAGESPDEVIYDWVEMVMADGNAMAIARNVTDLLASPLPPAEMAPAEPPSQSVFGSPPMTALPQETQNIALSALKPAAPEIAPILPTFESQAPEQITTPEPALQTVHAPTENREIEEPIGYEATLDRQAEDYLAAPAPQQAEAPKAPELSLGTPGLAPIPGASLQNNQDTERERMRERRALPIEDSSAVLGSNWRDQVIAKAVGTDTMSAESTVETPAAEVPEDQPAGSSAGLKILLAEDNAINALLTRTLLEADGAIVETVEDGALAVEAVKGENFDLILMDMRMPNMDGLEATRKIRAMGGKQTTLPIVALTANAFDDDRNACFDSGMNDFMTKPVSAEELAEMVKTWTNQSAPGIGDSKVA